MGRTGHFACLGDRSGPFFRLAWPERAGTYSLSPPHPIIELIGCPRLVSPMATMAEKRDYYEVLGVSRSATVKEIADAYRKLAIRYHPDKNPGDEDVIVRFKEAAEAFEVLNDSRRRERYDRFGHAGVDGPEGGYSAFPGRERHIRRLRRYFRRGGARRFVWPPGQRTTKGGDVRCASRSTWSKPPRRDPHHPVRAP